jgi:hypothetical protein
MVIGAELGREDHGSIPTTAIGRGLKPLYVKTEPWTKLTGGESQKKIVIKIKKYFKIVKYVFVPYKIIKFYFLSQYQKVECFSIGNFLISPD